MATHSSILIWEIPWPEESVRLQSMGSQRFGHDWATEHLRMCARVRDTHTHTHTHTHTPVYLKQYSRFEKKDTPLLQSLPGVIWFPYNIYCLFATKSFFQSHLVLVWNLEELALLPLIVANISIWNLSVLFCFSLQTNYFFPGSALSYQAFPDSAGNNQHAQLMCLLSSPLVSTGSRSTFWMRKWQPASVSLPGESYGQRSLVGYSP